MATISAISAFSGTDRAHIDTAHPDVYKLYPLIATNTSLTQSAKIVFGTNYAINTSGYNSYFINLCDYQPNIEESDSHASIIALPAYRASIVSFEAANHCKLFTSSMSNKYKYTGSDEESDYGSFGPIICRYARFVHLSGNVAYDYTRSYSSSSSIELITRFNLHDLLPTAFDDTVYKTSLSQVHIAWLSSYVESNLDERVARHVMANPAIVGYRMNTPYEFHSPIKVLFEKPANSYVISLKQLNYISTWTQRRIGRFLFDIELLV